MSRLGGERGMTLVEVLVGGVLGVLAMGAVLGAVVELTSTTERNTRQNDAQQEARRAIGELAAELRNLASPTNELPEAVERATATDIVFQSVASARPAGSSNERNTRRVRYCLDTASRRLWRQQQIWTTQTPPAMPTTASCPEAPTTGGWSAATTAADHVANGSRPVFDYNATALDEITAVGVGIYVDTSPAREPAETRHETNVFLRNQNRAPVASFTAAVSGSQIVLNGSASSDPEGRALTYRWYDGGVLVGEGIVFTYVPATAGDHAMTLTVEDPAGLTNTAPAQTVCVVGEGVTCG